MKTHQILEAGKMCINNDFSIVLFFFCFIGNMTWTHNVKVAIVSTFHCAMGSCPFSIYINAYYVASMKNNMGQ